MTSLFDKNRKPFDLDLKLYMQATDQENYKLYNTYAKTISDNKDVVVIQAKNLQTSNQIVVECAYEESKLSSLSVDNETIKIDVDLKLTE